MNNDEQFENRLRRQPLRTIPPAWRGEILAAAAPQRRIIAAPRGAEGPAALVAGWRLLFARLPVAWAALAALWVGLVGVNLMMPGPIVRMAIQTPPSVRWATLATLDFPAAEFDAERDAPVPASEASPAKPPSDIPLRPRSERRRGVEVGETPPDFTFHLIA